MSLEQIQAIRPVQRNIHDHQIRLQLVDPAQGRTGFLGVAANGEIRFAIDQQRQSLADDRMIVHDENRACCRLWRGVSSGVMLLLQTWRAIGNRHRTTVPPLGEDCTLSDPPIILAR